MDPAELVSSLVLVIVLLALAGYFGWRQLRALRGLRQQTDLAPEERRFIRNQARRRLVVSVLMVLLALMLVGNYFIDQRFREIIPPDREAAKGPAAEREHTPEEEAFAQLYVYYWVVFLLLILVFLFLVVADFMAIGRFGMRQFRRLQTESRSILKEQADRLRSQRNGHT